MATDNYRRTLDFAASVRVLRERLDDLHLDARPRPVEISKASKEISDALALGIIHSNLAVADELRAIREVLAS